MISLVAGARPNFMKIAPIVRALKTACIPVRLIHTGQHYDQKMSQTFFDELEIPQPDVNLAVGSGSHVFQIAEVMKRIADDFEQNRPNAVLVVGDVNSTVSAALTACKMGIPVGHVEAGLRSFDRRMPEEINRIVTDSICDWLFTSEPSGEENLLNEGISSERIHSVGNVMIDTLLSFLHRARELNTPSNYGLAKYQYAVVTLHRPSNVDHREHLDSILSALKSLAESVMVIFPMHPRTQARIKEFRLDESLNSSGLKVVEPLGYLPMVSLIDSARLVLTDSGGLQEETTALRVPCLTLRENTERPVTIELGSNRLVGWQSSAIADAIDEVLQGPNRIGEIPLNWDGHAAERIVSIVKDLSL